MLDGIENRFIGITVKYRGPTNHRGSKVALSSSRFDWRKTIDYDHSQFDSIAIAANWLEAQGAKIVGLTESNRLDVILVDWESGLKIVSPQS
jgi:hypothetical protein